MKRLLIFGKGMCMGIADVIPGVSGGTLALILGLYTELVDTIRNLNLRWLAPLFRWLKSRRAEDRAELIAELKSLNLGFLIPLGAGIAMAIVAGSVVIPPLMEKFPEAMRGLFFGLIMASVLVPFKMIDFSAKGTRALIAVTVLLGALGGYVLSNPSHKFESSRTWAEVESRGEGETLKDILRRGPSAMAGEAAYWAPENAALREEIARNSPALALEFQELHADPLPDGAGKDLIKERSTKYEELVVPAGVAVQVPQIALWFVFLAGLVAICAMILPGISGSYILLIFGAYFFILNALKGFLRTLASGELPINQGLIVIVFCLGCGIGLLSFARLLSYLLHNRAAPTLGVLVGLMIGCLRGIWPFRQAIGGVEFNVFPLAFSGTVLVAIGAAVVGMVIVTALSRIGSRIDQDVLESNPATEVTGS